MLTNYYWQLPHGIKNIFPAVEHLIRTRENPNGAIINIQRQSWFHDEPKLYHYLALLNLSGIRKVYRPDQVSGGVSFEQKSAIKKTIGEAIERYSLTQYHLRHRILARPICKISQRILDPRSISQKCILRKKKITTNDVFRWFKGKDQGGNITLIPAQLIFVPYHFLKDEPVIRWPITTGAACGQTRDGARLKGLCEVIERDSFMINYLAQLSPPQIIVDDIKIRNLVAYFERYLLSVHLFDLTLDFPVPTVMALLKDKTGNAPLISIGLKTHPNLINAIIGALEESQQSRPWLRRTLVLNSRVPIGPKDISTLDERALYWSRQKRVSTLKFLFLGNKIPLSRLKDKYQKQIELKDLEIILKERDYELYYVDVTPPLVRLAEDKLSVIKSIVPKLQPLYLDEGYHEWTQRLYEIARIRRGQKFTASLINKLPHPFL